MEILRDSRRTSVITLVSEATGRTDVIRACEPECRNEILVDLGVRGGRGGWVYRSTGDATVTVAWSGIRYRVSWKRVKATALPCDHCGEEWRTRMPELIARAAEQSAARRGTVPAALAGFSPVRAGAGRYESVGQPPAP